jgi:hypothetical protein
MQSLKQYRSLTTWLTLPLGLLAMACAYYGSRFPLWTYDFIVADDRRRVLEEFNVQLFANFMGALGLLAALAAVFAVVVGSFHRPLTWMLYRKTLWAIYIAGGLFLIAAGLYADAFAEAITWNMEDDKPGGVANMNMAKLITWWQLVWPWMLVIAGVGLLHTFAWRRRTVNLYHGLESPPRVHLTEPAPGDIFLEDVRTFGPDPQHRASIFGSTFAHVFFLLILPWLLAHGCVDPYYIPEGSGNPVVMMVQVVQPQKKKPKKYILRPNSAIYFDVPDLTESEVEKEVKQESEATYKANNQTLVGMMGAGGGKKGGWPEGMGRHPVRFIRLQYDGSDWNDGMGSDGADMAFLSEFEQFTGFKTANQSEAHGMRLLTQYPKGFAPPFVYMTGNGRINTSQAERDALREYLLDGGMLFADAGSRSWDSSFRNWIRQVFPGKSLVSISLDDPIFQMPTAFPNGPPMMWEHGGSRCLGMKHDGRWIVFYHPGDLNDAWKGGQVSGLNKRQTEGAFELGVNIIYYAFTHYLEETRKYRKK